MNSRERVLTAFDFNEPDRVPCWCGASVEFWDKAKRELGLDDEALRCFFGDDFRRVHSTYVGPEYDLPEGVHSRTVFGINREGIGYGHATSHPLANATMADVEAYAWPSPDWIDASNVKADAEKYQGEYAILGGDWSPFWHDAIDLLGMENLYIMMFEAPEVVDAVFKKTVDYYVASSVKVFDAAADAIDIFFIGNDLGSQMGPLMGPDQFKRFLVPHLKRLINLGHDYGLKTQMHCCGGIEPLMPILIDIELDALHALQPDCAGMDLAMLKKNYGDKIVLNGGIDSHHILINGTPDTVREGTRKVLEIMAPGGGYIAGASHDTILEETPTENVVAMFKTIREFGL